MGYRKKKKVRENKEKKSSSVQERERERERERKVAKSSQKEAREGKHLKRVPSTKYTTHTHNLIN
jgi:hypothetical protein